MDWIVEPTARRRRRAPGPTEAEKLAADVCNTKNICNTKNVCNTKNLCNTKAPPCGTKDNCADKWCIAKGVGCFYRMGKRAPDGSVIMPDGTIVPAAEVERLPADQVPPEKPAKKKPAKKKPAKTPAKKPGKTAKKPARKPAKNPTGSRTGR